MADNTDYECYVHCANCLTHRKMSLAKGTLVSQTSCPNCGNLTLEVDPNGALFDRPKRGREHI